MDLRVTPKAEDYPGAKLAEWRVWPSPSIDLDPDHLGASAVLFK